MSIVGVSWLVILGKRDNMVSFARERDMHGMNPSERYLSRHLQRLATRDCYLKVRVRRQGSQMLDGIALFRLLIPMANLLTHIQHKTM